MDLGIITELSKYLGIIKEAVIELGHSLGNNPGLIKAMITGFSSGFAKAAGESTLNQLGSSGDSARKLTQQMKQLFVPIAREYIENYTDRHGQLRVLGMGKPVSLESIYTPVNFFDPEPIQTFATLDTHEKAFRTRDWSKKNCRLGMEVANDTSYMMVLGGPGMGKSTFLRKVGLEALKQGQGKYRHACIPVFLELRKYRWDKATGINLLSKIAEEFENCGWPEYQGRTEWLLEQGKLLVLFDGLDEVPTELLGQMTGAIRDLVDLYSNNRFIASCRIADYCSFQSLSRFTTVAIANFDELQMRCFIENWFKSHDRIEWGQECQVRLSSDDHQATRELAQTPLLLTLICILFLNRGKFPTKRAALYTEVLSILLGEWDTSKEIVRQKIYKGLDTRGKEIMLAEIAYSNFTQNNLFFQQVEITKQIETILLEMLDKKRIDGQGVLRAVEEQHGLLVNRYDDIYSFSHLTIQEFLTAKHIIDNSINISIIVKKHLCDERWHEVFLMLAGLRKSDDLLLAIKDQIQGYVAMPKLDHLLEWVEKVSNRQPGDIETIGKRAMAINNATAIAAIITYEYLDDIIKATLNTSENINDFVTKINNLNITNIKAHEGGSISPICSDLRFYSITNDIAVIYSGNTFDVITDTNYNPWHMYYCILYGISKGDSNIHVIERLIEYAQLAINFKIYQGLDLQSLILNLENLRGKAPGKNLPEEEHHAFSKQIIRIWLNGFQLTSELMKLSKEDIQLLYHYLYCNQLLIKCERAAVRRTPEVWSQIEERLLRPAVTTN